MKKQLLSFLTAALMVTSSLAGCTAPAESTPPVPPSQTTSNSRQEEVSGAPSEPSQASSGAVSVPGSSSEAGEQETLSSTPEEAPQNTGDPIVYMTSEITPESLMAIYDALNASPSGRIAVKLSTGEPGSNYLRTDLIGDLVRSFDDPTIVECNTAYGGSRASTAMHYQVTEDHGYTAIAKVDIMDENGSMTLPVSVGDNLKENYVGANFANYDYFIVLSHFKGHAMAGFGGAIKNISIGIASSQGKGHIHSGGTGGSMWGGNQDAFLESMAEAG